MNNTNNLPPFPSQILLIVEDAALRNISKDYLVRAEFQVYCASNGWDALQLIKNVPVDLIVSDAEINETDGAQLREKCLLLSSMRDVPFLFLVETDHPMTKGGAAYCSGLDSSLMKPFDPVFLVARVQSLIEARKANDRIMRIDSMTRLLNRPTLEEVMMEELDRIKRYNRFGSMLVLDVDNLNAINQENGVAFGDLMLSSLAAIVLNNIRKIDIAGRYHDSMFMLFLPETNKDGARIVAMRVLEQLTRVTDKVAGLALTFSAGIVSMPGDGVMLQVLAEQAEFALQEAKSKGPGSIACWEAGCNSRVEKPALKPHPFRNAASPPSPLPE